MEIIHRFSALQNHCIMFPHSSVFWFVDFCFLPFLRRTRVQKWKKHWFCYWHKWIRKKEITAEITKYIVLAKILECKGSISPFSFYGQPPNYWWHAFRLAYPVDEFSFNEIGTVGQSKFTSCCICVLCKLGGLGGRRSPTFPCIIPVVETS